MTRAQNVARRLTLACQEAVAEGYTITPRATLPMGAQPGPCCPLGAYVRNDQHKSPDAALECAARRLGLNSYEANDLMNGFDHTQPRHKPGEFLDVGQELRKRFVFDNTTTPMQGCES